MIVSAAASRSTSASACCSLSQAATSMDRRARSDSPMTAAICWTFVGVIAGVGLVVGGSPGRRPRRRGEHRGRPAQRWTGIDGHSRPRRRRRSRRCSSTSSVSPPCAAEHAIGTGRSSRCARARPGSWSCTRATSFSNSWSRLRAAVPEATVFTHLEPIEDTASFAGRRARRSRTKQAAEALQWGHRTHLLSAAGGVAERPNSPVLKTGDGVQPRPWVRIPPPPLTAPQTLWLSRLCATTTRRRSDDNGSDRPQYAPNQAAHGPSPDCRPTWTAGSRAWSASGGGPANRVPPKSRRRHRRSFGGDG